MFVCVRACVSESTNIRYTMSVKLIDLRSTHTHTFYVVRIEFLNIITIRCDSLDIYV